MFLIFICIIKFVLTFLHVEDEKIPKCRTIFEMRKIKSEKASKLKTIAVESTVMGEINRDLGLLWG